MNNAKKQYEISPKTRNERYFQSTGQYKSESQKDKKVWGKEWKPKDINKSLTGY